MDSKKHKITTSIMELEANESGSSSSSDNNSSDWWSISDSDSTDLPSAPNLEDDINGGTDSDWEPLNNSDNDEELQVWS